MLAAIGVRASMSCLMKFQLRARALARWCARRAFNEMEIGRLMMQRAQEDGRPLCFHRCRGFEHQTSPRQSGRRGLAGNSYSA